MASLKDGERKDYLKDEELKNYLKFHHLPEVYECLLVGLMVTCPEDPYRWVVENIKRIRDQGIDSMAWDMFLPINIRPKFQQMAGSYLNTVFNFYDLMEPTPEMMLKAYNYYYCRLQTMCFQAWLRYYLERKNHRQKIDDQVEAAREYNRNRVKKFFFLKWHRWKCLRLERQRDACIVIVRVWSTCLSRLIFQSWRLVVAESRKTREYFERLERGELDEDFGISVKDVPSDAFRDDVSLLPRKCAIMIFSNLNLIDLSICTKVCRAWKIITGAPMLWTHLNFSRIKAKTSDQAVIQCVAKSRPYVVNMNLHQCFMIDVPAFKAVAECRNLQDLNISECKGVNDEIIRFVSEGCPVLLYLDISRTDITDGALRTVAMCCLTLQCLSLAYCVKFTDRGLYYLSTGKSCKKMTYLDLSGCVQVTPTGFNHIAGGCTGLRSLFLNDLYTLKDNCLMKIATNCSNLTGLHLLGSPSISDVSFKALAQCKNLRKIQIEGNQLITDTSFKAFGKMCPRLNYIYVVDCQHVSDVMMKALGALRNVLVVNVTNSVRISDSGVKQIVEGPSGSRIRELNLTNCIRISDVTLWRIAQRCHRLTNLNLCFCEHVTDAGIELLANVVTLTHVDLSGTNIQDQGLASLGSNPKLKSVTISECMDITDLGIQKFSQEVTELEELDVSHCMKLTDAAIKNLAFCCRMLTNVNLMGCPLFTDLSIQYLSGVCHYILYLNISGCIFVTDNALRHLRKGCTQLRVLVLLFCKGISSSVAHKFRHFVEKLEYSNDDVPVWYNYPDAAMLSVQLKPRGSIDGSKFIELENTDLDQCHSTNIRKSIQA